MSDSVQSYDVACGVAFRINQIIGGGELIPLIRTGVLEVSLASYSLFHGLSHEKRKGIINELSLPGILWYQDVGGCIAAPDETYTQSDEVYIVLNRKYAVRVVRQTVEDIRPGEKKYEWVNNKTWIPSGWDSYDTYMFLYGTPQTLTPHASSVLWNYLGAAVCGRTLVAFMNGTLAPYIDLDSQYIVGDFAVPEETDDYDLEHTESLIIGG